MFSAWLTQIIFGGLCYRVRGGFADAFIGRLLKKPDGWEVPNIIIRSIWALYVTAMVASHGYLHLAWAIFPLALLGAIPGYFGGSFDLSKPENRNLHNYALLTARGMFIMFLPAVFMQYWAGIYALWLGVIAGALFVPCYLAGNYVFKRFPLQGNTQWGEWLLGMSIGAVL